MDAPLKTETLPATDPSGLQRAVQALQAGLLVAFPTDTVYGVAGRAFDPQGIDQLYRVKQRDSLKAIAIMVSKPADLSSVTGEMGSMARRLAERFWPGPLTLVVPRHPGLPANLSPNPTIGVRMPDHPVPLAILEQTGPLAVTSANRSGGENANTAQEVFSQLGGKIPLILDGGRCPGGLPSTVVDCTGDAPVVLRLGPISLEDLMGALK